MKNHDTTKHTSIQARFHQRHDHPHAGLALVGEFAVAVGLLQSADRYVPKPGHGAGYHPSEYIFPLILILNGAGRSLEDTGQIRTDEGLREIVPLENIPSSDALGDWLRNMGGQW